MSKNIFFYILIRSRKSFKYFDRCIDSVLLQNNQNFKILFVDDASGYNRKQKKYIKNKLQNHVTIFNNTRKYSLENAYEIIHKFATINSAVVFNLDGDDWLLPNALDTVANIYLNFPKCLLTYGECLIWDGIKISHKSSRYLLPWTNTRYPNKIVEKKSFRAEPFRPLHPRTWKVSLFKSIPKKEFLDSKGKWLRFAEDQAIFFPMLEKVGDNYQVIKKSLYVYNSANVHADVVENTISLIKDEIEIRKKGLAVKKYHKSYEFIKIHYHKTLSLPIFANILYLVQIKLLKRGAVRNLYVSSKDNVLRDKLVYSIDPKLTLIIKSPKISAIVKDLVNYKIFDCPTFEIKNAKTVSLHDLMWTLTYSDAVTSSTSVRLHNILPTNIYTLK